jgi:hypothetical protein
MPEQFHFHRDDPTVAAALSHHEIAQVNVWQGETSDFEFEFHTQHEAGWPCYLREPDGPGRNLPKLNLKGDAWTGTLLQGESVQDQRKAQEFRHVITNNLAAFRKMADRFYEGVEVATAVSSAWFVKFTCTKDVRAKPVFIRLPDRGQILGTSFWSNMQRTAKKPPCPVHKNAMCLDGVAVQLQGQDLAKNPLRYDDSFDIR